MARRERQVKRVEEISPRDAVREAVGSTGKSSIQITQAGGSTVLTDTGVNVQSVGLTGTYYIYSFDGKLLAEYNGLGELMREYIYVGDRLLAEYQPQSNQLYYYTTDQVNSVRVVTNQTGVRVFAAAYDPYGGIQKIWENSYSPELKFSGKERDSESNLDYFGARYYANFSYRWLSPDPVINRDEAMRNPQLWNLYSFCRNNPATYWDPDGAIVRTFTQEGYEAIQRTMGDAYLAQNIFWDKSTGLIDINRMVETDNPNYLRLWYLVASPEEIRVEVTNRVLYINKNNEIKASVSLELSEAGILGIMLPPLDSRPDDNIVNRYDYVLCAVAKMADRSLQARTLAEELYGHAYLYIRGLPYLHERGLLGKGLDPNGFVNRYILRILNRRY